MAKIPKRLPKKNTLDHLIEESSNAKVYFDKDYLSRRNSVGHIPTNVLDNSHSRRASLSSSVPSFEELLIAMNQRNAFQMVNGPPGFYGPMIYPLPGPHNVQSFNGFPQPNNYLPFNGRQIPLVARPVKPPHTAQYSHRVSERPAEGSMEFFNPEVAFDQARHDPKTLYVRGGPSLFNRIGIILGPEFSPYWVSPLKNRGPVCFISFQDPAFAYAAFRTLLCARVDNASIKVSYAYRRREPSHKLDQAASQSTQALAEPETTSDPDSLYPDSKAPVHDDLQHNNQKGTEVPQESAFQQHHQQQPPPPPQPQQPQQPQQQHKKLAKISYGHQQGSNVYGQMGRSAYPSGHGLPSLAVPPPHAQGPFYGPFQGYGFHQGAPGLRQNPPFQPHEAWTPPRRPHTWQRPQNQSWPGLVQQHPQFQKGFRQHNQWESSTPSFEAPMTWAPGSHGLQNFTNPHPVLQMPPVPFPFPATGPMEPNGPYTSHHFNGQQVSNIPGTHQFAGNFVATTSAMAENLSQIHRVNPQSPPIEMPTASLKAFMNNHGAGDASKRSDLLDNPATQDMADPKAEEDPESLSTPTLGGSAWSPSDSPVQQGESGPDIELSGMQDADQLFVMNTPSLINQSEVACVDDPAAFNVDVGQNFDSYPESSNNSEKLGGEKLQKQPAHISDLGFDDEYVNYLNFDGMKTACEEKVVREFP